MKLKIAITGGIGSGKSQFAGFIKEMGYPVIDADSTAKDILTDDKNVREKIIAAFGAGAYNAQGLDTEYLAANVFSDPSNVKKINSVVHPAVIKKIKKLMQDELIKNDFVFVEAALIFEAAMEDLFDYVALVSAVENLRISRAIKRDDVDECEIRRRMENQFTEEFRRGNSDFVFDNNGTVEELKSKSLFFIHLLKNMTGNN
jgi:dephospho-CoA kinase